MEEPRGVQKGADHADRGGPGLRLGLAGLQQEVGQTATGRPAQPGSPGGLHRPDPALRHRCLGARLLSAVQERASLLRGGHLGHRQLG